MKKFQLNEFDILSTIGIGSFGRVRLGRIRESNEYIALKTFKKAEVIRLRHVDHVTSEVLILNSASHPFIVKIYGYSQDERYLYLFLEFIPGGDFFGYLRGLGKLSPPQAQLYAGQVVISIEYLHSKNIIYRDLKPENLLFSHNGYLKLIDFGFAKVVEGRTYTLCGTPQYMAPEILLNKGHGKPVDWWALGIFIYEMIAGVDPFSDENPMKIYQNILEGKLRFTRSFDKNAKNLVKHLLVADLTRRFGNLKKKAEDIKSHKFFFELNWTKLAQQAIEMPYTPPALLDGDTSNYSSYPDSLTLSPPIKQSEDPFFFW